MREKIPDFLLFSNLQADTLKSNISNLQTIFIDSLNDVGIAEYQSRNYHSSLLKHQEALNLALQLNDQRRIAVSLSALAHTELIINLYDSVDSHAQQLLKIARVIGEYQFEEDAFRLQGDVNYLRGEYKEAKQNYSKALEIAESIADSSGLSSIFHNLGNVYADQGQFEQATENYLRALRLDRALSETTDVGKSLYSIGLIYLQTGSYTKAYAYLDSAITIFEKISDKTQLGMALTAMGNTYRAQADYQQALNYLKQGLSFSEETGDTFNIAVILGSMGDVFLNTGQYAKAIQSHLKAGRLFQRMENEYNLSIVYLNVGEIYFHLGDNDKTLNYYQKSLQLKEEIGDQYGIGILMGNIGSLFLIQDSLDKATAFFDSSKSIAQSIGDKPTVARAYENLCEVYFRQKKYETAEQHILEAIKIFKSERMKSEDAEAFIEIGNLKTLQKNYHEAAKHYENAISLGELIGKPEIIWKAHTAFGSMLEAKKDFLASRFHYLKAIDILENIRLQIGTSEQRAGFLGAQFSPYESLIRVLAMMHFADSLKGYDLEAFEIAERSKAQSFLELLTESRADIRRCLSEKQKSRENTILRRISQLQSILLSGLETEDQKREVMDQVKKEEENLELFRAEIRQTNPLYADLKYPKPVDLETVQHIILKEGDLLAEFSLGENQSYLWLVSKNSYEMLQLPGVDQIEKQANDFLKELRQRPSNRTVDSSLERLNKFGRILFATLFGNAIDEIKDAKHIIIVPDGILFYLPFEALPFPKRITEKNGKQSISKQSYSQIDYLISHASLVYVPSATVLAQLSSDLNPLHNNSTVNTVHLNLLAFGDPKFPLPLKSRRDTTGFLSPTNGVLIPGIENLGQVFQPLPFTRQEVEQISTLFTGKTKLYLGDVATEKNLKEEDLKRYHCIHFATHGFLNEKTPGLSGLVMSTSEDSLEDGLLQMNEIFNLEMNADVVVLSACETGLGKLLKGEGLVGLTRAFYYAGARSMVVSLWKVSDISTAVLMKNFYSNLLKDQSVAAALREAKLHMLNSSVKLWKHPFHWAGFIVQGKNN